jgi:uncharacterized membrane protein YfcA
VTPGALVALLVISLVVGGFIGAVGVGGVLLVPALVLVGGLTVEAATPVATMSFFFTGVAGTIAYQRSHRIDWFATRWLVWAAIPGAIVGAITNIALPGRAITVVVAVMLGAAALQAFRGVPADQTRQRVLGVAALLVIGLIVGFGSTLSGTGGPVLLIPVLLLVGAGATMAVSSSQPIQIPIAVFGTASFLLYGVLDWKLATALGIVQAAGAVIGARLSNRLPVATLRQLVAWALALSAAIFIIRAIGG